jgi:2-polyprenyl-6-hydroxyphenyl methylase/3-demethylubiquinone-9 3-methyltransferase
VSVKAYYEGYWQREKPSFDVDPLAYRRLELLRATLGDAKVRALDAGCGHGDFVAALAEDGHDVLGLELSETAIDLARAAHPGCDFVPHSAEDLPWPVEAGSFDAVWSFEVVEHLLEPRRLFEGAFQALGPGGTFCVTTPFHGRAKNLVLALHGFDRHFAVEGDHIRFFSDAALARLAESTGFRVGGIRHFGRLAPVWAGVYMWAVKP